MSSTFQLNPVTYAVSNTSKTLSANNTTAAVPIFRVTGSVRFIKVFGVVTTVLSSNITGAYLRMNDQTAQADITLSTVGTVLSTAAVGSWLGKTALAATLLTAKNASAGQLAEPTASELPIYSEFQVIKKNGANTDIEFVYSTTNTPASGAIQFFVEWQAISADAAVTVL